MRTKLKEITQDFKEQMFRPHVRTIKVIDRATNIKGALQNQENKKQERREKRCLSDRDRDVFLALLDSNEEPNEALQKAAKEDARLKGKRV